MLAFTSLIASAQDLDRKVTFRSTALPATKLVKQLAAVSGLPLDVSAAMERDVVLLKATDVSAKKVMDRLAKALDASWVSRDGKLILSRTAADDQAERDAENRRLLSDYQRHIKKLSASLDEFPVMDDKEANVLVRDIDVLFQAYRENPEDPSIEARGQKIEKRFPVDRALVRLLRSVDLGSVARLGSSPRIVYSTAPTKMQVPLGSAGIEALSELQSEQAAFVKALGNRKSVMEMLRDDDQDADAKGDPVFSAFAKVPVRLILIIGKAAKAYENAHAELYILDAKGATIAHARLQIFQGSDDAPAASTKAYPLSFSEESKELAAYFAHATHGQAATIKALRMRMTSPDINEPLAMISSDYVLSVADQAGLNALAVLTDDSMAVDPDQKSVSEADIERNGAEDVTEAGGWLTVKPKYPVTQRNFHCDRSALAKLLGAASVQPLNIDFLADCATRLPEPTENSVFLYCARFAAFVPLDSPWPVLRFFGRLSPEQRSALRAGHTLLASQLSIQSREAFATMVYDDPDGPSLVLTNGGTDDDTTDAMATEPTERLPNGIPFDARVSATHQAIPVVFVGVGQGAPYVAAASTVAQDRYAQSQGKHGQITALYPGQLDRMVLTFDVTHSLQVEYELDETAMGRQVAYEQLPDAFRTEVESQIVKLKEAAARKANQKPPPRPLQAKPESVIMDRLER